MNVLVTGSSGFFGNEIVRYLERHTLFTLNRNSGIYKYDLREFIPRFNSYFDIVIHNAGMAHSLPRTETEKHSFFQVNVEGTKNLLKGLETSIPKQFVFISSVAVYGIHSGFNINENSLLNAMEPYGLSKVYAERMVLDWCQQNNVICTILRLPLLVGRNPPGNLGMMVKAIRNGYYFNIGGGNARKSMVLAEDVARFIPIISRVGGTYNLTDGLHPSFSELSKAIAKKKVKNLPLFLAKILGRLGDFRGENAIINSNKIRKITLDLTFDDFKARDLGWSPQSVLEYLKVNDL